MTYQELVKKVQTALVKADATTVEGHIAVQVNVTGEAAGAFYMEILDRVLYVMPYDYIDRDALLTADGADVLAVAQGKITLEAAVAESKIACDGSYDAAMALGAIIPVKKAPAKKAAKAADDKAEAAEKPKKAAAKKTAAKADAPAKKAPAKKAAAKTADAKAETAEKPKRTRKPAAKKTDK